jgi:hypothetical protein
MLPSTVWTEINSGQNSMIRLADVNARVLLFAEIASHIITQAEPIVGGSPL